jgi:hypothetical protein
MGAYGYQCYYNYQSDKYINEVLETYNKSVSRYAEMLNDVRLENEALAHNLIHEQAMYEASKGHVNMLEEQIDVVSDYWKKEYVKINDELFDIKNKDVNLKEKKIIKNYE